MPQLPRNASVYFYPLGSLHRSRMPHSQLLKLPMPKPIIYYSTYGVVGVPPCAASRLVWILFDIPAIEGEELCSYRGRSRQA